MDHFAGFSSSEILENMRLANKSFNTAHSDPVNSECACFWESAVSHIFEFAKTNGISPRVSQLALMYLNVTSKVKIHNEAIFDTFASLCFNVALKLEGTCHRPMHYTSETTEMEEYLLGLVLRWKLAYTTPYDFIQVLLQDIKENEPKFAKCADSITAQAIQISELLLFSYDTLNSYRPYSIALAALCAAMQLTSEERFLQSIDKFILGDNKDEVDQLLVNIRKELNDTESQATATPPISPETPMRPSEQSFAKQAEESIAGKRLCWECEESVKTLYEEACEGNAKKKKCISAFDS